MTGEGGESACWAHLVDADDARPGSGVVWSLPRGGDLDGNLVHLRPGAVIDPHVNAELDVLIVVWSGSGRLTVDGVARELERGVATVVPKGAERSIAALDDLRYLSIHRHRDTLSISPR
ncbi:MAG: cupin domain-containing protein [Ilumatobacter fluminis]|uniref:cupin domain-containing protein n=1 Tax=Ilumatobacter fluminis TaxID=467091 RepID=UPI0032ECB02C